MSTFLRKVSGSNYREVDRKHTLYDAAWSTTQASTVYANEILYAGYRHDPESGLFQVRYRHYHPTLGCWIQRDPVRYAAGLNLYQYVSSRPAGHVDPMGLDEVKELPEMGDAFPEKCEDWFPVSATFRDNSQWVWAGASDEHLDLLEQGLLSTLFPKAEAWIEKEADRRCEIVSKQTERDCRKSKRVNEWKRYHTVFHNMPDGVQWTGQGSDSAAGSIRVEMQVRMGAQFTCLCSPEQKKKEGEKAKVIEPSIEMDIYEALWRVGRRLKEAVESIEPPSPLDLLDNLSGPRWRYRW